LIHTFIFQIPDQYIIVSYTFHHSMRNHDSHIQVCTQYNDLAGLHETPMKLIWSMTLLILVVRCV